MATTNDPTTAPLAIWAVLRPFVLARMGDAKVEAIESYWRDPARGLAEPQTHRALLAELAAAMASSPLTPDEQAALVHAGPRVAAALPVPSIAPSPATTVIRSIVIDGRAADATAADALTAAFRAPDAATRWLPSASDGALEPKYGFERHAAFSARFLATAAEAAYKPMLRAALELTWLARGETKKSRNTLGALVSQCEAAWSAADAATLLDKRIVIIRNSEDHRATTFDAAAETVTFVNTRDDGTTTRLALTKIELGEFTSTFMQLCVAMHAGFATS